MDELLEQLAQDIDDVDEEVFLLFSQDIPSNSLGIVDSSTDHVSVSIGGKDLEIRQSTQLLKSNRGGGTTGAMLWQVTPRFANWLSDEHNVLWSAKVIGPSSTVVELGCGISGVLALTLASSVKHYVASDQDYVLKMLRENIKANSGSTSQLKSRKAKTPGQSSTSFTSNVLLRTLDWQKDDVRSFVQQLQSSLDHVSIDAVLACDCVYNESLVRPFVDTCAEICRYSGSKTLCIVAQQLRCSDVFENWLTAFHNQFRVWQVPQELISAELGQNSGFVVYFGLLRQE